MSVIGTSPAPAARAAGQQYTIFMDLARPKLTLCTGEQAQYKATVKATVAGPVGFTVDVAGVKITAYVGDVSVGTFTGSSKPGITSATAEPNPDINLRHGVIFNFLAGKKSGKTTLYFDALVQANGSAQYVSEKVDVRVIPCKFTVSTTSKFKKRTFGQFDFSVYPPHTVRMPKTKLTVDSNGEFSATSTMKWQNAVATGPTFEGVNCTTRQTFAAGSGVTITAVVNERGKDAGKLVVTLVYDSEDANTNQKCGGGIAQESSTLPYILDPVTVALPVSGATVTVPHSENQSSIKGSITVTVTADKGS